jgi:hypothetical protein
MVKAFVGVALGILLGSLVRRDMEERRHIPMAFRSASMFGLFGSPVGDPTAGAASRSWARVRAGCWAPPRAGLARRGRDSRLAALVPLRAFNGWRSAATPRRCRLRLALLASSRPDLMAPATESAGRLLWGSATHRGVASVPLAVPVGLLERIGFADSTARKGSPVAADGPSAERRRNRLLLPRRRPESAARGHACSALTGAALALSLGWLKGADLAARARLAPPRARAASPRRHGWSACRRRRCAGAAGRVRMRARGAAALRPCRSTRGRRSQERPSRSRHVQRRSARSPLRPSRCGRPHGGYWGARSSAGEPAGRLVAPPHQCPALAPPRHPRPRLSRRGARAESFTSATYIASL